MGQDASSGRTPIATFYRGSLAAGAVAMAIFFGLPAAGLIAGLVKYLKNGSIELLAGVAFLSFFSVLFGLTGLMGIRVRLRVFEDGIEGRGMFRRARFIAFEAATAMTWSVYEGRMQHTSTGRFVAARVRGVSGETGFTVPLSRDLEILSTVRDRLSEAIGIRGLEAINRGEPFLWGGVRLAVDGIVLANGETVAYSTPFRETFEVGGKFVLSRATTDEQLLTVRMQSTNFYPGYWILRNCAVSVERVSG